MKRNQTVPNLLQSVFGVLFIAVLHVGVTMAQPQSPERGFNPGKSYLVSDIETIARQSGNLMMNVPIGSLPPGRGEMSASLGLHYNSKLWDSLTVSDEEEDPNYRDTVVLSKDGGWRYGYKYALDLEHKRGGLCISIEQGDYHYEKLNIVLPDGSKHALRLSGYTNADGYMEIYPDGKKACNFLNDATFTGTITYYTTDGTYLRLEFEQDSDSDWANNPWTLYMPDGSRVHHSGTTTGTTQTIYDRNGNYIDIIENAADSAYSNKKTTYIKDALDRKIVVVYNFNTNEDRIYSDGFGGQDMMIKVVWRDIRVRKTYNGCNLVPTMYGCGSLGLDKTISVVDEIHVPDVLDTTLKYEFDYNADAATNPSNGWGEMSQVKIPSGAFADYAWAWDGGNNFATEKVLRNRPISKSLTYLKEYDGQSTTQTDTWTYSVTQFSLPVDISQVETSTMTSPDGSTSTEHYTMGTAYPYAYADNEVWKTVSSNGSIQEKYYQSDVPRDPTDLYAANRYTKYEYTTIADASGSPVKTAIREYSQDKNGNTTEVREYDFVAYSSIPRDSAGRPNGLPSGISSSLIRISQTEYYNATPDASSGTFTDTDSYHLTTNKRLLRLTKASEVQDASSTPRSRSEVSYDYTNYDSSNTKAGNPTVTKAWDSYKGGITRSYSNPLTSTNSITTSATYNSYGMPLTSTDANDIETQLTYGNVTCPGGTVTDLYPTQKVIAYGTPVAITSTATYDCSTGVVTSSTDEDNDITNATEYDELGRPIKAITAQGTALESSTTTIYYDSGRYVVVKSDLETKGDGKKVAIQYFDQLGRVRLARTLEDASTQDADDPCQTPSTPCAGIKVQTRYLTSGTFSYQLSSNPYRANFSSNETATTMGWTRSKSWNTGIKQEVETFNGASLPAPWGSNSDSTGKVVTDIDANATTVTDQASKVRRSITNGLGQLIRVDEPNSSNQLGSVSSPNQATNYTYNTMGKMVRVEQSSQNRYFMYDSLGRTLRIRQPEQEVNTALNTSGDPLNNSWTGGFTYS